MFHRTRSAISRAVIVCAGDELGPQDLELELREEPAAGLGEGGPAHVEGPNPAGRQVRGLLLGRDDAPGLGAGELEALDQAAVELEDGFAELLAHHLRLGRRCGSLGDDRLDRLTGGGRGHRRRFGGTGGEPACLHHPTR